jgi:hypothetical protein
MYPAVAGICTYVQLNDSLLAPLVPPVIENVVGLAARGTKPASAPDDEVVPVVFDDEHATVERQAAARTSR